MSEDLLISILAPGFIAGIALFLSSWAYQFFNSPRISLDAGEIAETDDGIIRVVVKNNGRSAAENCRGKISIECSKDDLIVISAVIVPILFRPVKEMPLLWTNTRSGNITINAHDNETLTVFQKIAPGVAVRGDVPPFENICVLRWSEGEEYHGKINVSSSNAKETKIRFRLNMKGDKINMELFGDSLVG